MYPSLFSLQDYNQVILLILEFGICVTGTASSSIGPKCFFSKDMIFIRFKSLDISQRLPKILLFTSVDFNRYRTFHIYTE